jgi:LPS-assembly protein
VDVPNEDSAVVEFDEGNLFSLTRYPGEDARERGLRATLGLSATRHDATGWSLGLTAGRVFKARGSDQYGTSTGLQGATSDWLVASHWSTNKGLTLSNRALIDDQANIARDELRLAYTRNDTSLTLGYLWLEADEAESRDEDISEILLDTEFPLRGNWSGSVDTRYNLIEDSAAKAELGLQYTNECVTVDLSLSRSFTSSDSVSPETSAGLSLTLAGFGASTTRGKATCTQ